MRVPGATRHRVSGSTRTNIKELNTVVPEKGIPAHGLRKGDLGAVVHVYEPDGLEIGFVTASGNT